MRELEANEEAKSMAGTYPYNKMQLGFLQHQMIKNDSL